MRTIFKKSYSAFVLCNAMILFFSILSFTLLAQSGASLNTSGQAPDPAAMLDISSTDKGLLIPRMSTAQRTAITPLGTNQKGLIVFDTDTNSIWYWTGSLWEKTGTMSALSPGTPGGSSGSSQLTFSSDPITGSGSVALSNTNVTPGSYTNAGITVDAQGRITSASNGASGGSLTCTNVVVNEPSSGEATANCAAGYTCTGGGWIATNGTPYMQQTSPTTNGWYAKRNGSGTLTVYARCCKIQ